ncbi:hypothetical protein AeMF1_001274 [Aphanomyces euteiches]|nr:hypothetical protein AeMF1_001274 [Aphanomyces euteiches]KAH9193253.1 hypothetical protein AeNC1_004762 [Aphanomyces euteiches]
MGNKLGVNKVAPGKAPSKPEPPKTIEISVVPTQPAQPATQPPDTLLDERNGLKKFLGGDARVYWVNKAGDRFDTEPHEWLQKKRLSIARVEPQIAETSTTRSSAGSHDQSVISNGRKQSMSSGKSEPRPPPSEEVSIANILQGAIGDAETLPTQPRATRGLTKEASIANVLRGALGDQDSIDNASIRGMTKEASIASILQGAVGDQSMSIATQRHSSGLINQMSIANVLRSALADDEVVLDSNPVRGLTKEASIANILHGALDGAETASTASRFPMSSNVTEFLMDAATSEATAGVAKQSRSRDDLLLQESPSRSSRQFSATSGGGDTLGNSGSSSVRGLATSASKAVLVPTASRAELNQLLLADEHNAATSSTTSASSSPRGKRATMNFGTLPGRMSIIDTSRVPLAAATAATADEGSFGKSSQRKMWSTTNLGTNIEQSSLLEIQARRAHLQAMAEGSQDPLQGDSRPSTSPPRRSFRFQGDSDQTSPTRNRGSNRGSCPNVPVNDLPDGSKSFDIGSLKATDGAKSFQIACGNGVASDQSHSLMNPSLLLSRSASRLFRQSPQDSPEKDQMQRSRAGLGGLAASPSTAMLVPSESRAELNRLLLADQHAAAAAGGTAESTREEAEQASHPIGLMRVSPSKANLLRGDEGPPPLQVNASRSNILPLLQHSASRSFRQQRQLSPERDHLQRSRTGLTSSPSTAILVPSESRAELNRLLLIDQHNDVNHDDAKTTTIAMDNPVGLMRVSPSKANLLQEPPPLLRRDSSRHNAEATMGSSSLLHSSSRSFRRHPSGSGREIMRLNNSGNGVLPPLATTDVAVAAETPQVHQMSLTDHHTNPEEERPTGDPTPPSAGPRESPPSNPADFGQSEPCGVDAPAETASETPSDETLSGATDDAAPHSSNVESVGNVAEVRWERTTNSSSRGDLECPQVERPRTSKEREVLRHSLSGLKMSSSKEQFELENDDETNARNDFGAIFYDSTASLRSSTPSLDTLYSVNESIVSSNEGDIVPLSPAMSLAISLATTQEEETKQ